MRSLSSWLKLGVAGAAVLAPAGAVHAAPFRFHYDHVLGTSLDVTAIAADETAALMGVTAAKREIERLDAILSDWRPDAELARLNNGESFTASPELVGALSACERWRADTGGAFDCRLGGPLRLWREAELTGGHMDAAVLARAVQAARGELLIDAKTGEIRRPAAMRLTLDAYAKGYVIDAAMKAARRASPGLRGLMIDIGGDLRCWGQAPEAAGWRVGLTGAGNADNAAPEAFLRVAHGAVAASGRGARDLRVEGCALSHTLAPTSGRPVAHVQGAVVLAPSAADADALATAFMVMHPLEAMALANRLEGVEALVTGADGQRYASDGWADHVEATEPRLVRTGLALGMTAAATGQEAARNFDLDIAYQVPRIDADPYHAPYLAIWVTDEEHKLVRTLLLLGQKPRYVTEDYVWWRRYGRETPGIVDAIAKPTRPPGRYTAHWDGRDEAGHPVAPGRYILHAEASREKGGHTYETAEFQVGAAAGTKAVPAKDELGPFELRYGPAH